MEKRDFTMQEICTAREWLNSHRLGIYFGWDVRVCDEYCYENEWFRLDKTSDYDSTPPYLNRFLDAHVCEEEIDEENGIVNLITDLQPELKDGQYLRPCVKHNSCKKKVDK